MSSNTLIAEDEPQNRKIQLTRRHYNVTEATSCHEAHATLIEKKNLTVILGDRYLPDGMNAQHIDESGKRTDQPEKTYVTRASRRALFSGVLASLFALALLPASATAQQNGGSLGAERAPSAFEKSSFLNVQLKNIIKQLNLTGAPSAGRTLPSINEPKAQLGMKLFFTKSLSGEYDVACVTCHHPSFGGGDDMSLSIGVDVLEDDLLGPGRRHNPTGEHYDGGPTVPRNAPTTFNLALWDEVLFHDGRVESLGKTVGANGDDMLGIRTPDTPLGVPDPNAGDNLGAAQARFPVTSPEEMKDFIDFAGLTNAEVRDNLAERLGKYGTPAGSPQFVDNWLEEFRVGFEDPSGTATALVTYDNIADAIATYENSQVFDKTPWRSFVEGNTNAIDSSAKVGALLFFRSVAAGGANCASCHTGDFFTDEQFHAIAMPQIGRGKGDGANGDDDFGRFRETGTMEGMHAFRTPSMLNVTETGPWGHAGAYTTLEAAVRHHLNAEEAVATYDYTQLDPDIQTTNLISNTQNALDTLENNRLAGMDTLENVELTDLQVQDLLAFLHSLTDPCVTDRTCLGQWIPDDSDSNPDSLRLNAVNDAGDFL
jgi:cytochrome c peroxidase